MTGETSEESKFDNPFNLPSSMLEIEYDPDHWSSVMRCSICLEFLNEPFLLQCGHSFCSSCVGDMVQHSRKQHPRMTMFQLYIWCPMCRRRLSAMHCIHNTPRNVTLQNVIEGWAKSVERLNYIKSKTTAFVESETQTCASEMDSMVSSDTQTCWDTAECCVQTHTSFTEDIPETCEIATMTFTDTMDTGCQATTKVMETETQTMVNTVTMETQTEPKACLSQETQTLESATYDKANPWIRYADIEKERSLSKKENSPQDWHVPWSHLALITLFASILLDDIDKIMKRINFFVDEIGQNGEENMEEEIHFLYISGIGLGMLGFIWILGMLGVGAAVLVWTCEFLPSGYNSQDKSSGLRIGYHGDSTGTMEGNDHMTFENSDTEEREASFQEQIQKHEAEEAANNAIRSH